MRDIVALFFLTLSLFVAYAPVLIECQFCDVNPCVNGTCIAQLDGNGFTCQCYSGFTGKLCDSKLIDPCQPNPCNNYGICTSNNGENFQCTCSPNYTGEKCETNSKLVQLRQSCGNMYCMNGGSCVTSNSNPYSPQYSCSCPPNYTGPNCATPVPVYGGGGGGGTNGGIPNYNPCDSNPCAYGSTCSYSLQSNLFVYKCICSPQYTGARCDQPVPTIPNYNPCDSNPCAYGSTCTYSLQSNLFVYKCLCAPQYTGARCDQPIPTIPNYNPCSSNPCAYGSTCTYSLQSNLFVYKCICAPQYTGPTCSQQIVTPAPNPCGSYPCANGGTCIPIQNNPYANPPYACICKIAFTGINCQTFMPGTTTLPYVYSTVPPYGQVTVPTYPFQTMAPYGQSTPSINTYPTIQPINTYPTMPPVNTYPTMQPINTYPTMSPINTYPTMPPYGQQTTTSTTNGCLSNPCGYGTCYSTSQGNFMCICGPNFTGTNCQYPLLTTSSTTTIGFYTNPYNNLPASAINACSSNPCLHGSTCISIKNPDVSPPYACICTLNYTGQRCEQPISNVNPCTSNPCKLGSTCVPNTQSSTFSCICQADYTGSTCNTVVASTPTLPTYQPPSPVTYPPMPPVPATNQPPAPATYPALPSSTASYQPPAPVTYPPLPTAPASNTPAPATYIPLATTRAPAGICSPNPCQSGGICIQNNYASTSQTYTCQCQSGYTGTKCETAVSPITNSNTCLSNPCYGASTCTPINNPYASQQYACVCPINYTGQKCDQYLPSSSACSLNPCKLGSTCVPNTQSNSYSCNCQPGYTGTTCNDLITTTATSPITNAPAYGQTNATVTNVPAFGQTNIPATNIPAYGQTNAPATSAQSNCSPNPCLNGATCTSTSLGYTCQCVVGFVGNDCEQRQFIDLCSVNSCYNGGTCQTQSKTPGQYTVVCFCPNGYTGSRCQTPISSATTSSPGAYQTPAYANGQTLPTLPPFTVPAVYQTATLLTTLTSLPPYQPGGYTSGVVAQTQPTPSSSCVCYNNGQCVNGVCKCPINYYGNQCEYYNSHGVPTIASPTTKYTCPSGLCVNGKCSQISQGGAFYCVCDLGWTGPRCNVINYCQTINTMCYNGGTCVNKQDGYSCTCTYGFTGNNCQTPIVNNNINNNPYGNLPSSGSGSPYSSNNGAGAYPATSSLTCDTNICQNGGSCIISPSGNMVCQCRRGYIGLTCDQDVCYQQPLTGPCYQTMTRYYYDPQSKQCISFSYGGCNGNENNFPSLESCMSNCQGH